MNLRLALLLTILALCAAASFAQPPASAGSQWQGRRQNAATDVVQDDDSDDSLAAGLGNPEGMVDKLLFLDTPEIWNQGEKRSVEVITEPTPRIELVLQEDRTFGRSGRWVSPEIKTDFPFTELLPSWNADIPEDTGVLFHVRTHDEATSAWSPWLYIGQWGKTVMNPAQDIRFDGGEVRIDVLRLKKPADAFQIRTTLQSYRFDNEKRPSIRRIAAVYSGVVSDEALRAKVSTPPQIPADWAKSIPVPFYAQGDNPGGTGGSTCSPTSLSMVAAYWGAEKPVYENCAAIYDPNYGMFGNWSRATQRAAELGLDSWLTRVRTWDQLKEHIGNGQPVIASIRFGEGEFPSNVLNRTNGHLIVVRGLTPEGDAIVNDPASKEKGHGVVYKADELKRAWIDKGGVAYIVRK